MIQKAVEANGLGIKRNELVEIPISSGTKKDATVKDQLTWKIPKEGIKNVAKRNQ